MKMNDVNTPSQGDNIIPPSHVNDGEVEEIAEIDAMYGSSFRTKPAIPSMEIYDKTPIFTGVDPAMRMDYSRLIGKPFHIDTFQWATTAARGTEMASQFEVPSRVISLNTIARSPFILSCLYHMKGCFVVQVAGTPMHGGCLVAAVLPASQEVQGAPNEFGTLLHTYQAAPHAFLHANSATSACIQIPWYSNTKLRMTPRADYLTTDNTKSDTLITNPVRDLIDYAVLRFRVLAPLTCPTAATTSVTVSIGIMFTELNFFVPKAQQVNNVITLVEAQATKVPTLSSAVTRIFDGVTSNMKTFSSDILDAGRGWLRTMTGLHMPNEPNPEKRMVMSKRNNPNYVDNESFFYKLDPYSTHQQPMEEYLSDTAVDEGLISHLVSKPMAVSSFSISTSTTSGTLLFSAPIHPCMFRQTAQNSIAYVTAPIDKLARMSRYYRGGLRLSIHNLGSSFHMFRLLVTREYYTTTSMSTLAPVMPNFLNTPSEVLEFSAGGQVQHVDLKQNSIVDYIPISPGYAANGLIHGRVCIFLLQPMTTNGSVATTADVAVHLSALPDFALYGYAVDQFLSNPEDSSSGAPITVPLDHRTTDEELVAQSSKVPYNVSNDRILAGSEREEQSPADTSPFRPIVHIRDHTRRMTPLAPSYFDTNAILAEKGIFNFDVYTLIFGRSNRAAYISLNQAISSMYYGYRGGLKIKILVRGAVDAQVSYIPPTAIGRAMAGGRIPLESTNPFPPASYPTGTAAYLERFSATRVSGQYSYVPLLETTDMKNGSTVNALVGADTAGADQGTDTSQASCLLEMHVPWMSMLRFVGSYSNHYHGNTDLSSISNDLGQIVVAVQPQYTRVNDDDHLVLGPIRVYPFVGTDDVGRFLYQVSSAPLALCVDTFSTGGRVVTNHNSPNLPPPLPIPNTALPQYYVGAAAI